MSTPVASYPVRTRYLPSLALVLFAITTLLLALFPDISFAQASGGLQKSVTTGEAIRDWLWLIIPVICLCIGGILGLAYSMDIIRKDTLYNWCIGVGFSGLIAGGIIELVF